MRFAAVLLLAALCAPPLAAQQAIVQRNSNGYSLPTTQSDTLARLVQGDELAPLSAITRNGYYNVRLPDGTPGWVFGNRIHVVPLTPEDPPLGVVNK